MGNKVAPLLIAVALLWVGTEKTYIALTNRELLKMSCAEYLRHRPPDLWLELYGCQMDLPGAAYTQLRGSGAIGCLLIPFRDPNDPQSKPNLFLKTTRPRWIDLYGQILDISDQKQQLAFVQANRNELYATMSIGGLIQHGIEAYVGQRGRVAEFHKDLAPNFGILVDFDEPRLGEGVTFIAIGLALLGYLIFGLVRRR